MAGGTPTFSRWFQRWWVALVGAFMATGGAAIYEAAALSIPRGISTYSGSGNTSDWYVSFVDNPAFVYLMRLGEVLMAVGLVAVIATVVVRVVQRRRHQMP
ncbi:hypothetical protein GCM10022286_08660 [Gryllotalpicola daejeonensis]|uniref:Uncharacterized protein n=1 Tax=Gryllotalpicola daejeonensis TaxID=993087 RepID=A0ABP7ZGR1_9MICO